MIFEPILINFHLLILLIKYKYVLRQDRMILIMFSFVAFILQAKLEFLMRLLVVLLGLRRNFIIFNH